MLHTRVVLPAIVFIMMMSFVFATPTWCQSKKDNANLEIEGVYSNMGCSSHSGDCEGMRLIILSSGDRYHAIVQIAEGGLSEPKVAEVTRKGNKITFTIPPVYSPGPPETFSGTVFSNGLSLKSKNFTFGLKRLKCNIELQYK